MTIPILFEDGEALVIAKPAGLPIERPRAGGPSLEDHLAELRLGFQRADRLIQFAPYQCRVGADRFQRPRDDPFRLAPPRRGEGLLVKRRSKGTPYRRRRGTPFSDMMPVS